MPTKPTLLFVPGAWHLPSIFDKVVSLLEAQSYKCLRVTLPTTTGDPSKSFSDDYTLTRSTIESETTQGRNVVIIAHSYGGAVGNSAIKGLTRPKEDKTSSGFVIGEVLLSSGFTIGGMTFLDGFGGKPPDIWNLNASTGFVELTTDERQMFYHDLPQAEGEELVSKLTEQSIKALTEGSEYTYAGWKDVPVWYVAATEDQALPVEAQRMFVGMAQEQGGDVTVRELGSSHSMMVSKPEETVGIIVEAVKAFGR